MVGPGQLKRAGTFPEDKYTADLGAEHAEPISERLNHAKLISERLDHAELILERLEPATEAFVDRVVATNNSRRRTAVPMMKAIVSANKDYAFGVALLAFVPAGFAVNYTHQNAIVIFVINFLAVFPSGAILAFGIDEAMLYVGDKVGALLSMSFG